MQLLLRASTVSGALLALVGATSAQFFPPTGVTERVDYSGNFVEYSIPTEEPPNVIRFVLKGGDGGNSQSSGYSAEGGRGLWMRFDVPVGTAWNKLAPGGSLRCVVGECPPMAIADFESEGGAGGGGGTAVLYRPPGSFEWTLLAVAGGGGGAYSWDKPVGGGISVNGGDAPNINCGSSGNCTGQGGAALNGGGGGGGWLTSGEGSTGGFLGGETGGPGGPNSFNGSYSRGGWGFGGGGGANVGVTWFAAGGGGGYSGGRGGLGKESDVVKRGLGGLSYTDTVFAPWFIKSVDESIDNGYIEITPLGELSGESCDDAILIEDGDSFFQSFPGFLTGPTLPTDLGCIVQGSFNIGAGSWYRYTNTSACAKQLHFLIDLPAFGKLTLEFFDACEGEFIECGVAGNTFDTHTIIVPGGATRIFRLVGPNLTEYTLNVTGSIVTLDADGDGIDDCIDPCIGSGSSDLDGDGIPDDCDACWFGAGIDCNDNGIDDGCDFQSAQLMSLFNNIELEASATLSGTQFTPLLIDNCLQLSGGIQSGTTGTLLYQPLTPFPAETLLVQFFARIDGQGGLGTSMSIMDADVHDASVQFGEQGPGADSITVQIAPSTEVADTIALWYDGQKIAQAVTPFALADGSWTEFWFRLVDGEIDYLVVREPEDPGNAIFLFDDFALPNYQPFRARVGFGASSGLQFQESRCYIDEVLLRDTSGELDMDYDGNGVLDSCEPAQQSIVLGTPANPEALAFGSSSGPRMGDVYSLFIEHDNFLPSAQIDWLFIHLVPTNLPLSPFGTLLGTNTVTQLQGPAGQPFDVPVPFAPAVMNLPLVIQGASANVSGLVPVIELTNAIHAVVGGWQPGS